MSKVVGTREISRNPSILRIDADEMLIIEDKKMHKRLGVYLGNNLAEEFFRFIEKEKLLDSAKKIKESAVKESEALEGTLADGL